MVDSKAANDRRSLIILSGVIGVYLASIIVLALLGHFTFVFKILVVPSLFLIAAATRRLRLFVHDWALFLALIALFDTLRGLIFHVTMVFDRPVYMHYAFDVDRLLGFGHLPTHILQSAISDGRNIRFLEKFLVVVHGSHFLFFLFFALLVWYLRRADFLRFQVGMLLVMYVGLLGYFLVPTVPPWMAANQYLAIGPIFHFTELVYNTTLPKLFAAFDTNPIAAMPSLHTAFPVYCCCVAFSLFGRRAIPLLIYTLVAVFALIYSGEHYLFDSLVGATLAITVWALTHRYGPLAARLRRPTKEAEGAPPRVFDRRLGLAVVILAAGFIGGHQLSAHSVQHTTSRDFIARELTGRSPAAHYYSGLILEKEKQLPLAQHEYKLAVNEMGGDTPLSAQAVQHLGVAAYHNGDHQQAIDALGQFPLRELPTMTAVQLGISLREAGYKDDSLMLFQTLQQQRPGDPLSLYWLTRVLALDGKLSPEEIRRNADRIRAANSNPDIERLAAHLDAIAARIR